MSGIISWAVTKATSRFKKAEGSTGRLCGRTAPAGRAADLSSRDNCLSRRVEPDRPVALTLARSLHGYSSMSSGVGTIVDFTVLMSIAA